MKKFKLSLKILVGLGIVLGITAFFVLRLPVFGGPFTGTRLERMHRSVEFVQGRFENWVLKGAGHSVYFSGDTGYSPHFAEIHRQLGDMDLTLMKVGAYGDTWLDIHMDPESSVRAHQDLGGKTMLPIHWGTFNLAYHAWEEPMLRTLAAASGQAVHVITPRIGEAYAFGQPFENLPWYLRQKNQ